MSLKGLNKFLSIRQTTLRPNIIGLSQNLHDSQSQRLIAMLIVMKFPPPDLGDIQAWEKEVAQKHFRALTLTCLSLGNISYLLILKKRIKKLDTHWERVENKLFMQII